MVFLLLFLIDEQQVLLGQLLQRGSFVALVGFFEVACGQRDLLESLQVACGRGLRKSLALEVSLLIHFMILVGKLEVDHHLRGA